MSNLKSIPRIGEPSPHTLMRRWMTEQQQNRLAREEYQRIRRRTRAFDAYRQSGERLEWEA